MVDNISVIRDLIRAGRLPELKAQFKGEAYDDIKPIVDQALAQEYHLKFMQYCWQQTIPMQTGLHTWMVCREIDKALVNFRKKKSTFLITLIPYRHGKSFITTRFLPAHFLAEFPNREVIVTSHSSKNTQKFSRFGRTLIRTNKFKSLYPGIELSSENAGVEEWGLSNGEGLAQYFGILSGSSGTGAGLLVTDDYFGTREDAESNIMRDKIYEAYCDNIFTRRDDPSISLITVTPWHADDLVGRLRERMKKDERTTQYKIITMPYKEPNEETVAQIEASLAEETDDELKAEMEEKFLKYKNGGYLFPERYSEQWYLDMEASGGGPSGYATQSIMRCDPHVKGGNELKTENAKILTKDEFNEKTKGLTFMRVWDLASSIRQLKKTDPDYTCGIKLAVKWKQTKTFGINIAELYIADIVRGRWTVTKRNETIRDTAVNDGLIKIYVEAVGGYKDSFMEIKELLRGIRLVSQIPPKYVQTDKHSKGSILVPIFDNSCVYLLMGAWNGAFLKEASEWPSGAHDDQIDPLAAGVHLFSPKKTGFQYNEELVV